jgi:hypothetical protein
MHPRRRQKSVPCIDTSVARVRRHLTVGTLGRVRSGCTGSVPHATRVSADRKVPRIRQISVGAGDGASQAQPRVDEVGVGVGVKLIRDDECVYTSVASQATSSRTTPTKRDRSLLTPVSLADQVAASRRAIKRERTWGQLRRKRAMW